MSILVIVPLLMFRVVVVNIGMMQMGWKMRNQIILRAADTWNFVASGRNVPVSPVYEMFTEAERALFKPHNF